MLLVWHVAGDAIEYWDGTMEVGIYSDTFKSVIFESVKTESLKIKIFSKSVRMIPIVMIFENIGK